jgi:hypothetical protein
MNSSCFSFVVLINQGGTWGATVRPEAEDEKQHNPEDGLNGQNGLEPSWEVLE